MDGGMQCSTAQFRAVQRSTVQCALLGQEAPLVAGRPLERSCGGSAWRAVHAPLFPWLHHLE